MHNAVGVADEMLLPHPRPVQGVFFAAPPRSSVPEGKPPVTAGRKAKGSQAAQVPPRDSPAAGTRIRSAKSGPEPPPHLLHAWARGRSLSRAAETTRGIRIGVHTAR